MCLLLCALFFKCFVSSASLRNFCISRGGKTLYILHTFFNQITWFPLHFQNRNFCFIFDLHNPYFKKRNISVVEFWNMKRVFTLSPFAKWKFLIRYSCKRDLINSAFVKCCDCQTRNLYILLCWCEKIFFIYSTHQCIKLQCLIFVSVP